MTSLEFFDGVLLLHVLVVEYEPVGDRQMILVVAVLQSLLDLGGRNAEFLKRYKVRLMLDI